jgi:hypothetical protein
MFQIVFKSISITKIAQALFLFSAALRIPQPGTAIAFWQAGLPRM